MRYPRGSIQLNQSRDLPLLRQILHSEFVTHSQLFEFMKLSHCERSRTSFRLEDPKIGGPRTCSAADNGKLLG